MKLYEDIQKLIPYLVSIRVIENVISIDVSIPSDWKIPKRLVDEKSILEDQSPDEKYRFFSFVCEMNEDNFTNIYNSVKNIIKYNKDREEKDRLFQEKINELKTYFEKQSLDDLKKLTFDFETKNTISKSKPTIIDEEVSK